MIHNFWFLVVVLGIEGWRIKFKHDTTRPGKALQKWWDRWSLAVLRVHLMRMRWLIGWKSVCKSSWRCTACTACTACTPRKTSRYPSLQIGEHVHEIAMRSRMSTVAIWLAHIMYIFCGYHLTSRRHRFCSEHEWNVLFKALYVWGQELLSPTYKDASVVLYVIMHMYQYVGLHFTVHHIKSYSSVNRTLQYATVRKK